MASADIARELGKYNSLNFWTADVGSKVKGQFENYFPLYSWILDKHICVFMALLYVVYKLWVGLGTNYWCS